MGVAGGIPPGKDLESPSPNRGIRVREAVGQLGIAEAVGRLVPRHAVEGTQGGRPHHRLRIGQQGTSSDRVSVVPGQDGPAAPGRHLCVRGGTVVDVTATRDPVVRTG